MPEGVRENLNPDSPRGQRNWFVLGWLALVVIFNLFVIISIASGGADPNLGYIAPDLPTSGAGVPIALLARAVIIVSAIALALGYKLGFYGVVAGYIVSTIASLMLGFNIGALLEAGLVLFVLWALIRGAWDTLK